MSNRTSLDFVAEQLTLAKYPHDIFGILGGDQVRELKAVYRRLSRAVHPDFNGNSPESHQAMTQLSAFYEKALIAINAGTYGQVPKFTVRTKKHTYEVTDDPFAQGDLADLYHGRMDDAADVMIKVVRHPASNDLMGAEASALKVLLSPKREAGEDFFPFLPSFIESLTTNKNGVHRRVNVFRAAHNNYSHRELVSLRQVMDEYPAGLDPRDMAWIWRRILHVLGYIHQHSIVHGALVPEHILLHPTGHAVVLWDWCFSSRGGSPLTAVPAVYKSWYPEEVTKKENPTPSLDIYTAAQSMIALMGGDPHSGILPGNIHPRIRGFLLSCLVPKASAREQSAWKLLDEFTALIEQLWGPRKYRPLTMPTRA